MASHVFGMNPSKSQVVTALEETKKIYDPLPETTCDHRALCCKAGCPNMYYAEYLSIRNEFIDKMTKDQKLDLIIECVKRYLQPQEVQNPKPCVFLGEKNMCGVYSARPLKCRLYGLIPKSVYESNVANVAKDMNIQKEKIPLCMQCDRVKIKEEYRDRFPDGVIPSQMLKDMETALRKNDVELGMPVDLQVNGFAFLTFHDWHIMFDVGESWMANLTQLRLKLKEEEKEHFVNSLKEALKKSL